MYGIQSNHGRIAYTDGCDIYETLADARDGVAYEIELLAEEAELDQEGMDDEEQGRIADGELIGTSLRDYLSATADVARMRERADHLRNQR